MSKETQWNFDNDEIESNSSEEIQYNFDKYEIESNSSEDESYKSEDPDLHEDLDTLCEEKEELERKANKLEKEVERKERKLRRMMNNNKMPKHEKANAVHYLEYEIGGDRCYLEHLKEMIYELDIKVEKLI